MVHIKDTPEAWEIFRKILKPWPRMYTLGFELPPGVATWPLPSEASISARGTASVYGLPLQRLPTHEQKFPYCTWITSMGMTVNVDDGDDANPQGP